MTQVVVTGAAGFVGSFLVDELLSRGYSVVGVDNLFRGSMANLERASANPQFQFERLDLAEAEAPARLRRLLDESGATALFHLAAINGTQYFYDASWMVLDVNVRTTQTVLTALEGSRVTYAAYTSSSEVYGEPMKVPTPESHPILLNAEADRDSYASSKALGDYYFRIGARRLGLEALVLRVFNQYGPRMVGTRYGQVIGEFIQRVLAGEKFTIIGDGSHTRSFCLVTDAARAVVDLFERRVTGYLNLGNDRETTILELARLIHAKMGRGFEPHFLPERPHDHRRRCPDISRLQAELPDLVLTPLETGLDLTIGHFRESLR
jgi:nucleoside-diphosphate-sugar epimerase